MTGTLPKATKRVFDKLIAYLGRIGEVAVFCIALTTVLDIVLRALLKVAVPDSYDICSFLLVLAVSFSFALSQKEKRHVDMKDLIYRHLPSKFQATFMSAVYLISCCIFVLVIFENIKQSIYSSSVRAHSTMLGIPSLPFRLCISIGLLFFIFHLLFVDIAALWKGQFKKREEHTKHG